MKKKIILSTLGFFFIILIVLVSATEINSPNYSGYFTQGSSDGNIIANNNYSGNTASFYQQAIGYLSDTLYQGIHGFSFQVASTAGFPPSLSIVKPTNGTYITGTNLPLNFAVINQNSVWYQLDSSSNTTLAGNVTFNTASGQHTIYLFANNSNGNSTAHVTFTVNTSKFIVYYSNYSGPTKGSSTDFNKSSYEELQNLSNVLLENANFGKIAFSSPLNITNDLIPSDNKVDLDSYTNISLNSIYVNITALPNLNAPATLSLYNLNFSNAQILKDGSICPPSICTKISYTVTSNGSGTYYNGTLVFNVTGLSVYSAQENVTAPSGGTTVIITQSGGGGGGVGVIPSNLFSIDKNQILVSIVQGSIDTEEITINNSDTKQLSFQISPDQLGDMAIVKETNFSLNPGESKTISIDFIARDDTNPDLYLGKIKIISGGTEKDVMVGLNVQSRGALLDVKAVIQPKYKIIEPGGDVLVQITMFNLGVSGRTDINVEYIIKDSNGNYVYDQNETVALETQASFIKDITTPSDINYGNYLVYVKTTYAGKVASATDSFQVVSSIVTNTEKIYIVIIIILIILLGLVSYYVIQHNKIHKKGYKKEEKIGLESLLRR